MEDWQVLGWLKESGTVEGWGEGMVRLSIVEKGGGTNKEIFNYRWYIYEKKKCGIGVLLRRIKTWTTTLPKIKALSVCSTRMTLYFRSIPVVFSNTQGGIIIWSGPGG